MDGKNSRLKRIHTVCAVEIKGAFQMAQKTIHRSYNKGKKVSVKSKSNLKISKALIIPESNVKKTKSNAIIHGKFTSKKAPKDDLCTHCGIRAKGPSFRYLCRYCFRKAGDEPVYSININTIGKDIFFTKISG
jgi:ribosomal protein S14